MRNVGGSIGISIATTLLTRRTDSHQNQLTNYMPQSGAAYQNAMSGAQQALTNQFGADHTLVPAQVTLYQQLQRQAMQWSFVDVFRLLAALCCACVIGVWFLKKVKPGKPPAGAH